MGASRGIWVRSSNRPNCRGCKRIGYEWLYKVGFDVIVRVDACHQCAEDLKVKAAATLPEKYRWPRRSRPVCTSRGPARGVASARPRSAVRVARSALPYWALPQ
jgi:hypothetical protein